MGLRATASALPFERIEATGENALASWEALRNAGRGFPIVVGGDDALNKLAEDMQYDARTPEAIAAAAEALAIPAALYDLMVDGYDEEDVASLDAFLADVGDWPAETPSLFGLEVARDHKGVALDKVHILLIPARTWFEVPAYLCLRGGEDCPAPEIHVAVLRSWDARYGIEIVGMGYDTLKPHAARRPATRERALDLAREHILYCSDVDIPLAELAASLMAQEWRYFWWD